VAAIERAEPGATDVRTLASYVEALGGRLEIIAEFAGDRVVLRLRPTHPARRPGRRPRRACGR